MATIIIQLNPRLLSNPDLDIRYALPDLLIEKAPDELSDDGYDYLKDGSDNILQIYLDTEDATKILPIILTTLQQTRILDNDLSMVPIAIEDENDFHIVHPPNFSANFPRRR